MTPKTDRIEARLTAHERQRITAAARLAGESVSTFVVEAAVERANQTIADHEVLVVPSDYFDRLLAALDEVAPSPGLERAVARARRHRRIQ